MDYHEEILGPNDPPPDFDILYSLCQRLDVDFIKLVLNAPLPKYISYAKMYGELIGIVVAIGPLTYDNILEISSTSMISFITNEESPYDFSQYDSINKYHLLANLMENLNRNQSDPEKRDKIPLYWREFTCVREDFRREGIANRLRGLLNQHISENTEQALLVVDTAFEELVAPLEREGFRIFWEPNEILNFSIGIKYI